MIFSINDALTYKREKEIKPYIIKTHNLSLTSEVGKNKRRVFLSEISRRKQLSSCLSFSDLSTTVRCRSAYGGSYLEPFEITRSENDSHLKGSVRASAIHNSFSIDRLAIGYATSFEVDYPRLGNWHR